MQTRFTADQLADPGVAEVESILRTCIRCGLCNAVCPTFLLTGDELDGPRGRIYLVKNLLENGEAPSAPLVTHMDRCLSCLSCATACPSGTDYMHLVDFAHRHIEENFKRPLPDRLLRHLLAFLLPRPAWFRAALRLAPAVRSLARRFLPVPLEAMLAVVPNRLPTPSSVVRARVFAAEGRRRERVALLAGCVQQVLRPAIHDSTIRLLTRLGCEVVLAEGAGCCGALSHHLGFETPERRLARANLEAWGHELANGGLDAIVVNASGCGTMVKDYGHLFRADPEWAETAAAVSHLARDVCEWIATLGFAPDLASGPRDKPLLAYQSPCSLHHGQRVTEEPVELLRAGGFRVATIPEAHLCCGSAGTYSLLQPDFAKRLRDRKIAHLEGSGAAAIATGNIGCLVQLGTGTKLPIVHTVELLDWASGGPRPRGL